MPAISFSTQTIADRDQVEFWREVATRAFVRHDFRSASGATFRGSLGADTLASLGVATFDCESCRVTRTARDVARDDHEDIQLCLSIAGKTTILQDNREVTVGSGDLVLVDTRRAFTADYQADTTATVLTLPRRQIEARLGRDADLAGHRFDPKNSIVGIMATVVARLPSCLEGLGAAATTQLAEHVLDLVAIAYSATASSKRATLSSSRDAALLRLKVGIDQLLTDPELKPAIAAAAAGISVRYANALLAREGTSVEEYIVMRRLERCRRTLEDPAQAHRTIADVAFGWGFSSIPHFCRRFKSAYGLPPGDYRAHQMLESACLAQVDTGA